MGQPLDPGGAQVNVRGAAPAGQAMKGRGVAWLAALPLAALLLLLVAPLLRLVLEGWGSAGQPAPSIGAMWQAQRYKN